MSLPLADVEEPVTGVDRPQPISSSGDRVLPRNHFLLFLSEAAVDGASLCRVCL